MVKIFDIKVKEKEAEYILTDLYKDIIPTDETLSTRKINKGGYLTIPIKLRKDLETHNPMKIKKIGKFIIIISEVDFYSLQGLDIND